MEKPKLTDYLQPVVILVSAVWAIATIQGTTERLGLRIDNLGVVIQELRASVNGQNSDLVNLKERVIRLELTNDRRK